VRKCGLNLTQVIIGQSVIPIVPLKEVIPVPDELGFELCGISDRQCGFERLGFSPTLNPFEVLIVVGSVADVWLSGWARPSRRCRDHRWCHSFRRQIATLVHRQKWVGWAGVYYLTETSTWCACFPCVWQDGILIQGRANAFYKRSLPPSETRPEGSGRDGGYDVLDGGRH